MNFMMTASEVAKVLRVSERTGYTIIRQLNQELKEKGFIIQAGRIPRKYFFERIGLDPESDQGKEVPHAEVL